MHGFSDAKMALSADTFVVRPARSLEDLQWMVRLSEGEERRPRVSDPECYFAVGIVNFFVGELNGERISCIAVVKYGDELAHVGHYLVAKRYRGLGYGLRTWNEAVTKIEPRFNAVLDTVVSMESVYAKSGFRREWANRRYDVKVANVVKVLSDADKSLPAKGVISIASNVDPKKLSDYDSKIFGACRANLVAAWVAVALGAWVVFSNDEIVGYLILRKTILFSKQGYRAAPFFADDSTIAKVLLKTACKFISEQDTAPDRVIAMDIPVEFNPEGVHLYEQELSGTSVLDTIRMMTKGKPNVPLHKVFSIGSLVIG